MLFLSSCESLCEAVSNILCIQRQKGFGLKLPFFSVSLSCLETCQNAGGNLQVHTSMLPKAPKDICLPSVCVKTVVSIWVYEQILFDLNFYACVKLKTEHKPYGRIIVPGKRCYKCVHSLVCALFDNTHMII